MKKATVLIGEHISLKPQVKAQILRFFEAWNSGVLQQQSQLGGLGALAGSINPQMLAMLQQLLGGQAQAPAQPAPPAYPTYGQAQGPTYEVPTTGQLGAIIVFRLV